MGTPGLVACTGAALITEADQAGRVYELAGDQAYTLSELAAEIARQSGQPVVYNDMPEDAYQAVLVGAGLPEGLAAMLADSDIGVSKGGLFGEGGQISALTGHPTISLEKSVAQARKA